MHRILLTYCAAAMLAACASTTSVTLPAKVSNGVFVNESGMTLYTFDRDTTGAGKSTCNEKCAVAWPPLKVAAGHASTGDWSVITREDGTRQWAYKGKLLYLWIKDQKPGDRTGDGVDKVWQLARP